MTKRYPFTLIKEKLLARPSQALDFAIGQRLCWHGNMASTLTLAGVYSICRVPPQIAGEAVNSAAEAAGRLMDEFDLAVVPWDTPHHSYLRFSSLYHAEDLERLSSLRETLRLA